MAKKPKKEAVKPEAVKPEVPKGALAQAKQAVTKAATKVAAVAAQAAEAVKERVVQPVVEAVKPKKVKRPRFVREKTEKRARDTTPALPPPSTKSKAKLMSKGIVPLPPDDNTGGPLPRA